MTATPALALPSNVNFGHVTGRIIHAVGDTPDDPDRFPDARPARGTVTFRPTPQWLLNPGATPDPTVIVPNPVVCTLDEDGFLTDEAGARGVYLVASTDEDLNPVGWTYTVTINLVGLPTTWSFSIEVPIDSEQDLASLSPVASSPGNAIVVGPPGPPGPPGPSTPGEPGSRWWFGYGPPDAGTVANPWDFYLDLETGDIWTFDGARHIRALVPSARGI